MGKLILLTMVLGVFVATNVSAAPTTCTCYGGQDESGNWWYLTINGYPLWDGDWVYVAWTGPDGAIDPPATAKEGGKAIGDCTDDDVKLKSGGIYWGGFTLSVRIFDAPQNPTTGDKIYCRIFDADSAFLTHANYYYNSNLHTCTHVTGEKFFAVFPEDPGVSVGLMSFEAVGREGQVVLKWKTASEVDNFGFHIERSLDAETFHRITQKIIPGAGDSETENTYDYVDRELVNGIMYYYNLISVDMDGLEEVVNAAPVAATPKAQVPNVFRLNQNYPNPFNPVTEITYAIPRAAHVTLKVYNVLGHEVATLVDADREANFYMVRWDAGDLAGGVYFCRLRAGGFSRTIKMVFLK